MRSNIRSNMRPTAIIPLIFTLVAFILSLLCVFAGSKRGYLENANLLTVNTSMLGNLALTSPTASSPSASATSIFDKLGEDVDKLKDKGENAIKEGINDIVDEFAELLGIHDFYSYHLLDYCEGFYTPSPISNETSHPKKNVTHCSNSTGLFHFDPTNILEGELNPKFNLDDLKWPDAIRDAVAVVETASKVMFILYCIGIAATGLALIGAFFGVFTMGRLSAAVNLMLTLLAFISLGIASTIASVVIVKIVNAINKYGDDIGLAAYKGSTFLGMTWSAVVLIFLTTFAWGFLFIRGRKHETHYASKERG